ncbi:MAG: hypothetical protein Q8R76_02370 [Candidatus Omnitrophota bacterium]|nr:hypothetical protein [Candidatus Omnitrophota bacterium]
MNRTLTLAALLAAVALATSTPAYAVTFFDALDFSGPLVVTDTLSGNQINYTYAHDLTAFPQAAKIHSVELSLTHKGNLNEGPTREIWIATTPSGTLLGTLLESDAAGRTDTWSLDVGLLKTLLESGSESFLVGLSEQTAFNSEKIELIRSRLDIDYDKIPQTPEAGTLALMLGGLAAMRVRRRLSKTN